MLKRIFIHLSRQALSALAVVLFAAVLAVVLCYLHQVGLQEQASFEQTYASVPVTFRVTDLDGSKPTEIAGWIVDLFGEQGVKPNLAPFVEQLHVRSSLNGVCTYTRVLNEGQLYEVSDLTELAGIGSLYVAQELTENWGGKVIWLDGYDESILSAEENVCLVPEGLKDVTQVNAVFSRTININGNTQTITSEKDLKVVGYYVDKGNSRFYCPYFVIRSVCGELGVSKRIEELCAVLNDNTKLDELKEVAALWFAKPNPAGTKTEWGRFGYDYYFYAMDINDTMLKNLEYSMKNSMRLNTLASAAIFVLSAGAGFLTGFLVIRSRKREIILMRTMGSSQSSIFTELALEQLVCVAAGIIVGGSYSLWQPLNRLTLFGGVYFVGLTAALLIFLKKNLMSTIKEDE